MTRNADTEKERQPPAASPTGRPSVTTLGGGFPGVGPDESGPPFRGNIFDVDETTFRSSLPRVTHWSIAWSDLMMTMFILFLSMFVYQAAHKEFLVSDEIEVIGGQTAEALDVGGQGEAVFPFVPIKPGAPLMTAGTVKKVEPLPLQDIEVDAPFFDETGTGGRARLETSLARTEQQQAAAAAAGAPETAGIAGPAPPLPGETGEAGGPAPAEDPGEEGINRIFTMETEALARLDLKEFASIDLVPDNTMRIVLTGDLLFDVGRAELSGSSMVSLEKIASVIRHTPYMINVVGHTDNIPMHSERYATNWELSVARASTVARFLIEEMGMNPGQFVVSGYSSHRPLRPNTNARNRAVNRRVEIIISKRMPPPVSATAENLN